MPYGSLRIDGHPDGCVGGGGGRGVLAKGHSAWMLKQGSRCFSQMVILTSDSGEAARLLTLTSDPIERRSR